MHVDLLINNAAQLLTLASEGPKRGAAMGELANASVGGGMETALDMGVTSGFQSR